jgi:hypothetical protein
VEAAIASMATEARELQSHITNIVGGLALRDRQVDDVYQHLERERVNGDGPCLLGVYVLLDAACDALREVALPAYD